CFSVSSQPKSRRAQHTTEQPQVPLSGSPRRCRCGTCSGTPCRTMASPAIETTQTPQRFNPTQAACCCSRLVALALDEEGLHVLILPDLHGCALGSVSLCHREERLLRLRHHRAR